MKICFIAPKAYPLFNPSIEAVYGGAEVQLYQLGKELSNENQCKVSFMVADYGQNEKELIDGVEVYKTFNFDDKLYMRLLAFFDVFKKIDADIYVQRTLTMQSAIIALYCKIMRKKFVYMVASDSEVEPSSFFQGKRFQAFIIYLLFRFSTAVIAQNVHQRKILSNIIKSSRLFVLRKGIDFSLLAEIEEKRYAAVWVGRCINVKKPEIFLDLVERNRSQKFLMICPQAKNEEPYFDMIKNRAELINNLNFIDYTANKDMFSLLALCKIFVITSEKEGWPQVVLEAAAMKLPILSYKLDYDDLISIYKGGVVCHGNFNMFNNIFRELLEDKQAIDFMGNKAYQYVKSKHDIKKSAGDFLVVVDSICNGKKRCYDA